VIGDGASNSSALTVGANDDDDGMSSFESTTSDDDADAAVDGADYVIVKLDADALNQRELKVWRQYGEKLAKWPNIVRQLGETDVKRLGWRCAPQQLDCVVLYVVSMERLHGDAHVLPERGEEITTMLKDALQKASQSANSKAAKAAKSAHKFAMTCFSHMQPPSSTSAVPPAVAHTRVTVHDVTEHCLCDVDERKEVAEIVKRDMSALLFAAHLDGVCLVDIHPGNIVLLCDAAGKALRACFVDVEGCAPRNEPRRSLLMRYGFIPTIWKP
jgi:hypothetical protein